MNPSVQDARERRLFLKLGLRNGLLIGLALALGAWAPDALSLIAFPVRLVFPSLLLGCLALTLLGGLTGWLAAWLRKAYAGGLVWAVTAVLMAWTIGHLPYEGRSLIAWLADRRFWGLPVYPFDDAALIRLVMAGFFVMLLLTILGLLQDYRLEGLRLELNADGRLTGRAWFGLLLPLPLVIGVGLIADHLVNSPLRVPPRLVHEVIRTGRTYSGDLFALSLERGVNYNAISGVRDQMSDEYWLSIGQVNLAAASTIFVVTHFDNGAWINCRVVSGQVSNCSDASPSYQQGLSSLLTTGQIPEDCPACYIRVSDEQRDWFLARLGRFVDSPRIDRLAQQGSYVLMRAESPGSGYAVECLFSGLSPVRLEHCQEIRAANSAVGGIPSPTRLPLETARLDPTMFDPLDRLGPPSMSDPPTQVELGHYAYYLSCLVCHGDQGQGLEEWRKVLDPEERNCWQSRCHAANHPPDGFQLPHYAPPLMGPGTLARFQTAADLYEYLHTQMPWQAPGILLDEEYWQLTAFFVAARGLDPGAEPLTRQRAEALELH